MTKTKPMTDEWKERLKKFYTEEVVVCSKCGHLKENHWWNGGGRAENSGYDACHSCDCSCMGEEVIKEIVVEHQYMIDFIDPIIAQATSRAREEELDKIIDAVKKSYETQRDFNGDIESRGIAYGWNNCLDFIQSLIQKDK